jgi:hypothetical protein
MKTYIVDLFHSKCSIICNQCHIQLNFQNHGNLSCKYHLWLKIICKDQSQISTFLLVLSHGYARKVQSNFKCLKCSKEWIYPWPCGIYHLSNVQLDHPHPHWIGVEQIHFASGQINYKVLGIRCMKTSPWANPWISRKEPLSMPTTTRWPWLPLTWFLVCNDIIHSTFIALHTKWVKRHNTCKQLCKLEL